MKHRLRNIDSYGADFHMTPPLKLSSTSTVTQRRTIPLLLALWKDADPNLPLQKQAFALHDRLK
jgi:hypothetical protein